jgi:hypothetical protein
MAGRPSNESLSRIRKRAFGVAKAKCIKKRRLRVSWRKSKV